MKNLFSNVLRVSRPNSHKENLPGQSSQDYVANAIGKFGKWQCAVCTVAILTRFIVMWNMTSILFLTPETDFVCVEFKEAPVVEVTNSTCYEGCLKYKYQNQGLKTTPISDYGLICERQWLASLAQSILMFGMMLSTTIFGWISDRFGRRISLIISVNMNVIFMLATPFSPNFWIFCCFRFLTGVAIGGALNISIVYVMEIVGNDLREVASCAIVQPDGLAQASLAIFAYYSPTWNIYAFGYGAVAILILVLVMFVPESPRWLISRGRIDEAIKVIKKAAKCNKSDTTKIEEDIKKSMEELNIGQKETVDASYIDFFKKKSLGLRLCCVFVIWSISGTCFFGINQYLTFVSSNLYVAVVTQGLIQMPVGVVGWLINKFFGRKHSSIGILAVTGIVMTLLMFTADYYWATTVLGVIGFGAINSIFGIIYVYVSELFPTPMRNMAFGAASIGAKLGAMFAPFIANMRPQWMPCLVFAVILFVAIVFCLPLPETKGQTLKDTID